MMLDEAILKIRNEMNQNANNPYVRVIGQFLLDYINNDPEAAAIIARSDKTIIKSLDAMRNEAAKKKVGNCAVLTDDEGFDVVLIYYGIPKRNKKEAPVPEQPKVESFDIKLEDFM